MCTTRKLAFCCIMAFAWRIERNQIRNFKNLDYHLLFIGCWEFHFVRSFMRLALFCHACSLTLSLVVYRRFVCSALLLEAPATSFVCAIRRWAWFHLPMCTVTQRNSLKIREYFRIWVKVESFQALCTHTHHAASFSLVAEVNVARAITHKYVCNH